MDCPRILPSFQGFIILGAILLTLAIFQLHTLIIVFLKQDLTHNIESLLQRASAWDPEKFEKLEVDFQCSGVRENFETIHPQNPSLNVTMDTGDQSEPHPNCNFAAEQMIIGLFGAVVSTTSILLFASLFLWAMCHCCTMIINRAKSSTNTESI
jgi:hypothetical protein